MISLLVNQSKRCVTLLEVLIAMVLTILVLSTLMFFYHQVTQISTEIDKIKTRDFYMRYVENRLMDTVAKSIAEKSKANDFVFFSFDDEGMTKAGSQNLIFTFDNGVSLDKTFSNHVIGRLFLDKDGRLTLTYWPSPKRLTQNENPPIKKEILFEGADSMSFEFFIAPDKSKVNDNDKKKIKPLDTTSETEPEPKGDWRRSTWLKEFNQLPAIVKIIIKMANKEEIIFVFPLVNSQATIIYD